MTHQTRIHVHLPVHNLAESIRFYAQFLGDEPVKQQRDYAKFLPAIAPLNLALSPGKVEASSAQAHLGIEVASTREVEKHRRRVTAAGLRVRIEQSVECCYANQDKFWVTDPDGRQWEIYHVNSDIEHRGDVNAETEESCCDTSVCCAGSA